MQWVTTFTRKFSINNYIIHVHVPYCMFEYECGMRTGQIIIHLRTKIIFTYMYIYKWLTLISFLVLGSKCVSSGTPGMMYILASEPFTWASRYHFSLMIPRLSKPVSSYTSLTAASMSFSPSSSLPLGNPHVVDAGYPWTRRHCMLKRRKEKKEKSL